jgi:tripeptide aminopeptidase
MINKNRLVRTFTDLIRLDSPSKHERSVADYIKKAFAGKVPLYEDGAADRIQGTAGNLILTFRGRLRGSEPVMFLSHMDTVASTKGISPVITRGRFATDGKTILGADDKAGVAAMIELGRVLLEGVLPFGTVQLVFTVAEEIGLQGAKHLDYRKVTGKTAFVLDGTNSVGSVIVSAPSLFKVRIEIIGKSAHSGIEPEKGINAIAVAAEALRNIRLGKLDAHTTANIGKIHGGTATNIVPDRVTVEGEVRSLIPAKITPVVDRMRKAFERSAHRHGAKIIFKKEEDFKAFDLARNTIVKTAQAAARACKLPFLPHASCGGSDANVLNLHGIASVVLGLGITGAHTPHESIPAENLCRAAEFIAAITKNAQQTRHQ